MIDFGSFVKVLIENRIRAPVSTGNEPEKLKRRLKNYSTSGFKNFRKNTNGSQ